jgi:hypothetical protein
VHHEGQLLSLENVARVRVLQRIVQSQHVSDQARLHDEPAVRPDRAHEGIVSVPEFEFEHQRHHVQRDRLALAQEAAQQADYNRARGALGDLVRPAGIIEGRRVSVLGSPSFCMIL